MLDQALAIARKDIREYLASKTLVLAVFVLPVMMAVSVPSLVGLFLGTVPASVAMQDTRFLPPVLKAAVETLGPKAGLYWYLFTVVTLPLFMSDKAKRLASPSPSAKGGPATRHCEKMGR